MTPYQGVADTPTVTVIIPEVTLEDGETVHNAFPDRNFKGVKS